MRARWPNSSFELGTPTTGFLAYFHAAAMSRGGHRQLSHPFRSSLFTQGRIA
jgi:hypothetical protein